MIRTILVPTDFSPETRNAMALAAELSEALNVDLHLLYVHEMLGSEPPPDGVEAVSERLEQAFRAYGKEPRSLTCARRDGVDVPAEILEYATEYDADLIIIGRHGRRGLQWLWLSGTVESIMSRSECSVMVVPAGDHAVTDRAPKIRRILLPVDFSRESEQAVPVARELAARSDASLDLLYVAEKRLVPIFSDTGIFTVSTLEPDPEITGHAGEALTQLYQRSEGPEVPVHVNVRQGQSAHEILAFSESENIDLIVMGSHGISGYRVFGMGSTAERVVDRAVCPVLVLKSFGAPAAE